MPPTCWCFLGLDSCYSETVVTISGGATLSQPKGNSQGNSGPLSAGRTTGPKEQGRLPSPGCFLVGEFNTFYVLSSSWVPVNLWWGS